MKNQRVFYLLKPYKKELIFFSVLAIKINELSDTKELNVPLFCSYICFQIHYFLCLLFNLLILYIFIHNMFYHSCITLYLNFIHVSMSQIFNLADKKKSNLPANLSALKDVENVEFESLCFKCSGILQWPFTIMLYTVFIS